MTRQRHGRGQYNRDGHAYKGDASDIAVWLSATWITIKNFIVLIRSDVIVLSAQRAVSKTTI